MIGIIGAMESEVLSLIAKMEDASEEEVGGIHYHIGTLSDRRVVIARAGVGKVNAALCAQTMMLRYSPAVILNTGVAGAVSPALSVGDAVVATALVEHDMDTTPLGDPAGLLSVGGQEMVGIPADARTAERLTGAATAAGLTVLPGVIASGDRFVASVGEKARIRDLFGAAACEMEGAAVAHACCAGGVPFGVLRVISDTADGQAHVDFPSFVLAAAEKSADAVLRFLAAFPA